MNLSRTCILTCGLAMLAAAVASTNKEEATPKEVTVSVGSKEVIAISPPPFSEGIFPCSQCHSPDDEVDRTPHPVDFHDTVVLNHGGDNRWCLDCHDAKNRDMLHLADGRLLSFDESFKLCGQCHAVQLKGWIAGDHGRRTGSWSGKKHYMLCANCHDPHSPKFKPLTPMPPPIRQEKIR